MITQFVEANRFLSNFYPCQVEFEGDVYATVEHAYQAAKTVDPRQRLEIRNLPRPGDAKRMGNMLRPREDWPDVKLQIMETLLRQKFAKPQFRNRLLATGNQELVEGNSWGDRFYGMVYGPDGKWRGENHLGKLLMKIRGGDSI